MTTPDKQDELAAEEYALQIASNFSSVPDNKISRHDIAKAAKYGHEKGAAYARAEETKLAKILVDALYEASEDKETEVHIRMWAKEVLKGYEKAGKE